MSHPKVVDAGRRELGDALRDRRAEAGMTLRDLAAATGMSFTYLGACERGEGRLTLDALVLIADAYGVLVVDLLDGVVPYGARAPRGRVPRRPPA